MCATDTPLGIALRNIRIHSASFEYIKWFSVQEVFHVYLSKFENDASHLFLAIFDNY